MFMSLGREGYTAIMRDAAEGRDAHLPTAWQSMGPYRLISDGSDLPVFAFATKPDVKNYTVFDVSERLREHGWLVPAYTFPENRQDLSVLRVVVRAGMHKEMADDLLDDTGREDQAAGVPAAPLPVGVAEHHGRLRALGLTALRPAPSRQPRAGRASTPRSRGPGRECARPLSPARAVPTTA